MKISVVVPAYNDEKYLPHTLYSLTHQTYKKKFELLVVDNGSADKTVAIAKSFGARVVHEKIRGEAYARAAGFYAATGDIIVTTDSDTIVAADWLEVIDKTFSQNSSLVAISGWLQLKKLNLFLTPLLFFYNLFNIFQFKVLDFSCFTGCNIATRKSAFYSIGGFRCHALFPTEADFYERVKKIGKVDFNSNMKVYYNFRTFDKYGFFNILKIYIRGWFSFNFLCGKFAPEILYFTKKCKPAGMNISFKKLALLKIAAIIVLTVYSFRLIPLVEQSEAKQAVTQMKREFVSQAHVIRSEVEPFFDMVQTQKNAIRHRVIDASFQ